MSDGEVAPLSEPVPAPMLQGPTRQHYLPEFYLEEFCRDGMLWLFDRVRNEYRQQQPLNTGVVGHLYTVRDAEDRKRFEIEAMLAKVEGDASQAMHKLDRGEAIKGKSRNCWSDCIAIPLCKIRTLPVWTSVPYETLTGNCISAILRRLERSI